MQELHWQQEIQKNLQEFVEKVISAQAAATPVVVAAKEEAQELKAQVERLQQTVAELKASYQMVQGQYFQAWADKGAAEAKITKLEAMVREQAESIKRMESPFKTPLRSAFAASHGEPPSLANMPVQRGGMFSPVVGGQKVWSPGGDQGADLKLPPCVPGVPFFFNPAVPGPVYVVAPASPVQAGSKSPGKIQTAGKEEAKGPEVRKEEEEGGQPAAAAALAAAVAPARAAAAALVAPVAAAEPADAAVCPQGRKGTGSKVRLPDRQPGESGVTPDAKVTRSAEPAGAAAASSEEEAGGLAPMRLNSNFSAAAGQAGPAEGRPEWRQTGSGEWRIAGKGKGKDKDKRGFKPTRC
jgi:hypothetical protein